MLLSLGRERRQAPPTGVNPFPPLPTQAPPEKKGDAEVSTQRFFQVLSTEVPRQYVLLVAVVTIAALGAASLFSFVGRTQDDVRPKGYNATAATEASGGDESFSVIKQAFESNEIQDAPGPSPSSQRNRSLLCRFSPRYQSGVYPYGLCTHLIYASVQNKDNLGRIRDPLYVYDPNALRKFVHVRETTSDVKLLLSVGASAMLRGDPKGYDHLAGDAVSWLQSHHIDGLHLSGLSLLPRNIPNITALLRALRKPFKKKYLITIGVDQMQKAVEPALMKILHLVDYASFRTSRVIHTDERTTLTNPYRKYDNSTSVLFLESELEKLSLLAKRAHYGHVCFTLTLGGNKFTLEDEHHHGLGAPAKHSGDAPYSEICNTKWDEVKYISPALGFYARKGSTWIAYDTEKTLADKVRLAVKKYPNFCIMLSQVDRDDYGGACSEKHFPLVQSVKHALHQPQDG